MYKHKIYPFTYITIFTNGVDNFPLKYPTTSEISWLNQNF